MIQNLAEKWKKHRARIGLIFTVTAGVFVFAMTYVAYFDQQTYARMQTFLYDCGIDAIGALVAAGLFYGCMRQEGEGTNEFRALNVSVSAGFVVNFLLYCTAVVPAWNAFYLHIRHAQQADRPFDDLLLLSVREKDARL